MQRAQHRSGLLMVGGSDVDSALRESFTKPGLHGFVEARNITLALLMFARPLGEIAEALSITKGTVKLDITRPLPLEA